MEIHKVDGLEMLLILWSFFFYKKKYFFKYHSPLKNVNIIYENGQYEFQEYVYKKKQDTHVVYVICYCQYRFLEICPYDTVPIL